MLSGHTDTPTGLAISPNGSYLLSPSFSSQSIIHDIRPFAPSPNRVHRVLSGAPAGFENTLLKGAWSREDGGRRVAVGGADRTVTIWDVESSKILYKVRGAIFWGLVLDIIPVLARCGSCLGIRVLSRRWISIPKNRSVRDSLCHRMEADIHFPVLTASKDGTMLLGEIEPGAL